MDREIMKKLIQDQGLCGEVAPDDSKVCILPPHEEGPHGWESVPQTEEVRHNVFDQEKES